MLTTLTRGSAGNARALCPWRVREGGGGRKKGFGVWWGWGNFPPCRTTSQHVPSANTRLTHTRRRNENKQTNKRNKQQKNTCTINTHPEPLTRQDQTKLLLSFLSFFWNLDLNDALLSFLNRLLHLLVILTTHVTRLGVRE